MQENTEKQPVLTAQALEKVQEIQENYESGIISEVLETLKDHYSMHTDEDKDKRQGIIETAILLRDFIESLFPAPIPPAAYFAIQKKKIQKKTSKLLLAGFFLVVICLFYCNCCILEALLINLSQALLVFL